jgi:hypothetical protein
VLLAVLNITVKQSRFCCTYQNIRHGFSSNSSSKNEGRRHCLIGHKVKYVCVCKVFSKKLKLRRERGGGGVILSIFIIAAKETDMFTAVKVPRQLLLILQVKLGWRQCDLLKVKKPV